MPREIKLSQGKVAIVDDCDYKWLSEYKWSAASHRSTFYALRKERNRKPQNTISMHREILNAPDGMQVDHIDGNGLNNQRNNIRLATSSQNAANRKKQSNNTSGYRGVYWSKQHNTWKAEIKVNGKVKFIGYFKDTVSAAHAYDTKAKEVFGEFARLNFP